MAESSFVARHPWLVAGVTIVVVLSVLYVWSRNRAAQHHVSLDQTRQQNIQRCSRIAGPSESIFVVILNEWNAEECMGTICSLFLQAACPYRVFVGVGDSQAMAAQSVTLQRLEMFAAAVAAQQGRPLDMVRTHVRVYTAPGADWPGRSAMRAMVFTSLYQLEMYACTVDAGTTMALEWEHKAVEQLKRCHLESDKPILTMDPVITDAPADVGPPSVLCLSDFEKYSGLPVITSRRVPRVPVRPMQQLFYSPSFSFTYASTFAVVMFDREAIGLNCCENIVMSARLWTHGYDFFVPMEALAFRARLLSPLTNSPQAVQRAQVLLQIRNTKGLSPEIYAKANEVGGQYGLGKQRSLREYEVFAGIDFVNFKADRRSALGLINSDADWEVFQKFGSREHYTQQTGFLQPVISRPKMWTERQHPPKPSKRHGDGPRSRGSDYSRRPSRTQFAPTY